MKYIQYTAEQLTELFFMYLQSNKDKVKVRWIRVYGAMYADSETNRNFFIKNRKVYEHKITDIINPTEIFENIVNDLNTENGLRFFILALFQELSETTGDSVKYVLRYSKEIEFND